MKSEWAPSELTERKVVIGEGNAEERLVAALIEAHGIPGVQVVDAHGNTSFRSVLEAYATQIDDLQVEVVALVADNDDDPAAALDKIQADLSAVIGLALPIPQSTWTVEAGSPAVAIVDLPDQGQRGTIETLIWPALENAFQPEDERVKELMTQVRTGTSGVLTVEEKARVSAMLASTCMNDPSCMVHWMWQANKGYRDLLRDPAFDRLVAFLAGL